MSCQLVRISSSLKCLFICWNRHQNAVKANRDLFNVLMAKRSLASLFHHSTLSIALERYTECKPALTGVGVGVGAERIRPADVRFEQEADVHWYEYRYRNGLEITVTFVEFFSKDLIKEFNSIIMTRES